MPLGQNLSVIFAKPFGGSRAAEAEEPRRDVELLPGLQSGRSMGPKGDVLWFLWETGLSSGG